MCHSINANSIDSIDPTSHFPIPPMRAIALSTADPAFQSTSLCCKCKLLTDPSSSTACLSCSNIFHSSCLRPNSMQRCPDCRVCKACKARITSPTEGALQCSECKGLFHSALANGKPRNCSANAHAAHLSGTKASEWKCWDCLKCKYCACRQPEGTGWSKLKQVQRASFKKSAKWMNGNSTCNECYLVEQLGQQCPICKVLYADGDESVPMVTCDSCEAWVHVACDSSLCMTRYHEMTEDESIPYWCPLCKKKEEECSQQSIGQQLELAVDFFSKVARSEENEELGMNENEKEKENSSNCSLTDENNCLSPDSTRTTQSKENNVPAPLSWVKCVLCHGTKGEESDWLSPLFQITFSEIPEALPYFALPDVFIHQKCAFYASLMCKEDSASRFCDFLLSRAATCEECKEKGAMIYCQVCKAYFHHFCHRETLNPSGHRLQLEPFQQDHLSSLHKSLDRRLLVRFLTREQPLLPNYSAIALKLITGNVIRTSSNLEALQIFNRESQLTKTLILDTLSQCTRISISQSPRAFKPLFKSINYGLGANTGRKDCSSIKVVPSQIAGIGVIATKPFSPGETVIEYIGQAIGKVIADKRERLYEQRGMGSCYMFKIEEDCIIDATLTGNRARFINHSCDPNCKTKTVTDVVKQMKKIVIYCCRKIEVGEEICYDYKFPLEDAKIPCNCGAMKCRGFMN